MDQGRIEQDFQEETGMLLSDYSNTISLTPHSHKCESIASLDLKPIFLETPNGKSSPAGLTKYCQPPQSEKHTSNTFFCNGANYGSPSSRSTFNQKLQINKNLDTGGVNVKNKYDANSIDASLNTPNLTDNQLLTLAFADLSFKESTPVYPTMSGALPNCELLLNGQYLDQLRKYHHIVDSVGMLSPSSNAQYGLSLGGSISETYPTLASSNRLGNFYNKMNGLENGELNQQQGLEQFMVDLGELRQSLPLSRLPVHHHPHIEAFQVRPSNFLVPEVDFPVSAFQHQYYLDPQMHSRVQPRHLGGAHITWKPIENERYSTMHPQYMYWQQLQNTGPEVHSIQVSEPASIGSTRNLTHQYLQAPRAGRFEKAHFDLYGNNSKLPRGINHPDHSPISPGFCLVHAPGYCQRGESCLFAHDEKQTSGPDLLGVDNGMTYNLSEKILTRSHGLNSIKCMKPGTVEEHISLKNTSSKGRRSSNGHFTHHSSTLTSGIPFQLDGWITCGTSPANLDLMLATKSQLQKYNSVDEVMGKIYSMAKDQQGCRFLQRKFTEGTSEDVQKIFVEIIDHIVELMINQFGNYLVQKLLDVCNEDQLMQIVSSITRKEGDLIRISCDMHGTRAVQKVIETLKAQEQISMVVSSLKPDIVVLIKDINGNHVAQRCLQHLPLEYNEFLFDAATAHCVELATDRHGCCVMQKCILSSVGEQKRHLMAEIISNSLVLSQDPFGNYVVQFVIELGIPWVMGDILDQLDGCCGYLSMQKYSSNVVEKCLKYAGQHQRGCIIQELISSSRFDQILQDPYGNYVIQSALASSKGAIHAALVEAIRPHIPSLRSSPYGRKVLTRNGLNYQI